MSGRTKKWVWLGVAVFVALQMYFVRELVAAEVIFALVIGIVLGLGFLFFLLEELTGSGLSWFESRTAGMASLARRQLATLEELGRKPFRRFRSQPADEAR